MRGTIVVLAGVGLLTAAMAEGGNTKTLQAIGQGRALYLQHCAACHGADAKGTKSTSAEEETLFPDLTLIEQRDGQLDVVHVEMHIEGRRDGLPEETVMPCAGTYFRDRWPHGAGASALQIWKLAKYLEFIQEEPVESRVATSTRK